MLPPPSDCLCFCFFLQSVACFRAAIVCLFPCCHIICRAVGWVGVQVVALPRCAAVLISLPHTLKPFFSTSCLSYPLPDQILLPSGLSTLVRCHLCARRPPCANRLLFSPVLFFFCREQGHGRHIDIQIYFLFLVISRVQLLPKCDTCAPTHTTPVPPTKNHTQEDGEHPNQTKPNRTEPNRTEPTKNTPTVASPSTHGELHCTRTPRMHFSQN